MKNQTKGFINGIVSGVSFGLIPLFSIPVIASGMGDVSILVYRFLFGCAFMLAALIFMKIDLRISVKDLSRITLLSVFYIGTAIFTLKCYHYLSSGIATSLVYTDPIWCSLIGLIFLGSRFSWKLNLSVVVATLGVMMMTGVFTEDGTFSLVGVVLGLLSGLSYALYIIMVPRLKVSQMPSLKLTFYVFLVGMFLLVIYSFAFDGGVDTTADLHCWTNLLLLGLIPTAISNICVTMSLKLIDSTMVAILGAFEPLTAMLVGIAVLGEPFSLLSILGAALVLAAVGLISFSGD